MTGGGDVWSACVAAQPAPPGENHNGDLDPEGTQPGGQLPAGTEPRTSEAPPRRLHRCDKHRFRGGYSGFG